MLLDKSKVEAHAGAMAAHTNGVAPLGEGRRRVIVERVTPQVDGGRFAIKRVVGEVVQVEADAFTDGHDAISVLLRYRHESATANWALQLHRRRLGRPF